MDKSCIDHIRIIEEETEQSKALAEWTMEWYNPTTVIDIGCSTGIYLVPFYENNVSVVGVDNDPRAGTLSVLPVPHIKIMDAIDIKGDTRYDIALCIETLEHIELKKSLGILEKIAHITDTILFSAAVPGQGGISTVKPKSSGGSAWAHTIFI